jgi:hypothetical protein
MAEAITEMIIPGTYIEVRAEGLIGVSGIATGNVGIVGTACKGPVDEAVILSSFSDAKEIFGDYDPWVGGNDNELTLVRALQQAFANGASTVYAVRTAPSADYAFGILTKGDDQVVTLTGKTKGTWAGEIKVQVGAATENGFVEEDTQTVSDTGVSPLHANIASSKRNVIRLTRAATGKTFRFRLETSGKVKKGEVVVVDSKGVLTFHADDQPVKDDTLKASYEVDSNSCRQIVIAYRNQKETYTVVDAADLKGDIERTSSLVDATITNGADGLVPDVTEEELGFSGGANGEAAAPTDYESSLTQLDGEQVNIVVLAGLPFSSCQDILLAHVENAENNGKERIAVVGVDDDDADAASANGESVDNKRLILVAPGIKTRDLASGEEVGLNAAYAAASVAGLIASLAVQVSPTNKTLQVAGLTKYYNDGELKKLLNNRVMPLEKKEGYRIVKGITTDSGAFKQVSVRRIVDYAKAGTRIGSLPYIGRLNNARVRGALKATLNGFLSDMVLNEALTEYSLEVTATREQEINGVALVTMYLKPTFSIDYIKVIMNLS